MPNREIIQFIKGKRFMQLTCGEVKRRKYKFSKQFQLTGNRFGKKDIRIGSLRQLKPLRDQWRLEGVLNLLIEERIEDETGLRLQRVTI